MSYPPPPGPPNDGNDYQPTAQQPAQPQYGRPAPQYGQPYTPAPPVRERALGVTALVLTVLGAAAVLVGMFVFNWFSIENVSPSFSELRDLASRASDAGNSGWTTVYFIWAAYVIAAAAVVLALLAALPIPGGAAFRVLGAIVALAGAAYTIFGPALDDTDDFTDYLKHGIGLYVVAGGFVLIAIGALIGSRRRA